MIGSRCSRLVLVVIFIYCSFHDRFMARGKNDLILRDRLQFTLDANGDLDVVYGRIDLSDYVSVVNNQGLAIKEMRIQIRDPNAQPRTGTFNPDLISNLGAAGGVNFGSMTIYGTTTAYESASDVGIGSPNTFFQGEYVTFSGKEAGATVPNFTNVEYIQYGTPDLHSRPSSRGLCSCK